MAAATDPRQVFLEEAAELLIQLEAALLALEDSPADQELVATAFRALHTIKGSGAMFGFEAVADFTHHLENAFDRVRKGELEASPALIGVALAAKDHIRSLIESPTDGIAAEGERLLARVAALVGPPTAKSAAKSNSKASAEAPATWRVRFTLAGDALERGANPFPLLDELRALGPCTVVPITEGVPPLVDLDPCRCYLRWDVLLTTAKPRSTIEEVFIFVDDDAELKIEPVGGDGERLGDILVQRGDVTPEAIEAVAARQERLGTLLLKEGAVGADGLRAALAEQKHVRETTAPTAAQAVNSIRVPAERLDSLMDQVGELVIAQARLNEVVATGDVTQVKAIAEELERLSNGLRDTTMSIRTVPIGSLFDRFRRLVRDLSKDLGKSVKLTMSGEETELDKTVIERLNDPLVHIVRNSLDHGVEDAAARTAAGKPRQGEIHLSASHSGAQVLVRVRDDGKGLDRVRIRAKAEEQGLVAPGAVLTDNELFQLIFAPGFSTAKTVTAVSGRGVGMDVVKRAIDSLRGSIEVTSVAGHGTEITLSLPLTLAIIDGLLVRVGQGRYVIPLSAVEECVELSAEEDLRHVGRNFLNIRGELVPFMRLRQIFRSPHPADTYQKVVVVSTGERRVGLVVDQVIGDHQTVIKSLSRLHADVENFSGATILGDGSVALILDVGHLVAEGQALESPRQVPA
jgi:two-component system chemotaxis sensor kinase CheA